MPDQAASGTGDLPISGAAPGDGRRVERGNCRWLKQAGPPAQGISHGFAVSDGDTVKFGRQRVRLFGIDAPEKGQPCDDGHWYPGPLATKALIAFIAGRPVSCHQVDYDQQE